MLLSGVVLGILQSKRFSVAGLRKVQGATLRRVVVIVVAQYSIVLLGLIAAFSATREHRNLPPVRDLGLPDLLWGVFSFHLSPPAGSVLRLYVILMLLALFTYFLLARGWWIGALAFAVALYGAGYVFPQATAFTRFDGGIGANWATWQLMFTVALVIGWYWRRNLVAERLTKASAWVAVICTGFVVLAYIGEIQTPRLFTKVMFAPGTIVNAFAVVTLMFIVVTWTLRVLPRWVFRPIELIGSRSLDGYLIQAAVAVVVPSFVVYANDSQFALMLALATLATCWGWAEMRLWNRNRLRSHSLPDDYVRRTGSRTELATDGHIQPGTEVRR
ncbi:OpgC domain-containing protein [Agromyces atrinae]|uniref:Acyltransferase n=1 Tax=Agromyces atrinae TaxID=592376 RepID=A0A4Q2M6L6_9MICO|nr:OpgC domain-containing protein [Agromyces atrinae]NYD68517.1 hypothetical protein [Agromyces atrinae]RXZ85903.1 hypothetical protein ESP50_11835 [Agromyces atrinae]